jgi:hypothetical protein
LKSTSISEIRRRPKLVRSKLSLKKSVVCMHSYLNRRQYARSRNFLGVGEEVVVSALREADATQLQL